MWVGKGSCWKLLDGFRYWLELGATVRETIPHLCCSWGLVRVTIC